MILHEIFTPFFLEDTLDIDNTSIVNFCEQNIKPKTNSGRISFEQPEFKELLNAVQSRIHEVHKHIGLSNDYEQYIWKFWANLNVTDDIAPPHCHPESFLSCVYYAKASENSGRLEFLNPVSQMIPVLPVKMIDTYTKYNAHTWFIDPEPGKLLIFPSWLWHYVTKNKSQDNRISIAMDTKVKLK